MQPILLASSSPYRRQLLEKLGLLFESESPDIDESALPDEQPYSLVKRLSLAKAEALRPRFEDHLIIASDQVASLNGRILTKPNGRDRAIDQLRLCSGQSVAFYTGLTVMNFSTQVTDTTVDTVEVTFRDLKQSSIERYIDQEQPFDCAGSFKVEGLGISLFSSLKGKDPNTLIGLPLIDLVSLLAKHGVEVP